MPTLDWIGKQAVVNHDKDVPFRLLKQDPKLSVGDSQNLIIKGDNLEALKALMPYYVGKVKCIYIDPPYNTGNEKWKYNDNVNSPQIKSWLGKVVGMAGEDLSRDDKWLCMMYPRLKLLHELLAEDGAIFVSIDYNEEANLRLLLDEVFGRENYRNTFIVSRVKKNIRERERVKALNFGHNSVVFYGKSDRTLIKPPTRKQDKKQRWHAFDAPGIRPTMEYDLFGHRPPKGRHWMYSEERAKDLISKKLLQPNPKSGKPQYRLEESSETLLDTNWTDLQEAGFDWNFANGEKNVELMKRIIGMICGKCDLVLDSFAGSGTTGHATLQMNKEDGGTRKFVLVEMESDIAERISAARLKSVSQGWGKYEPTGGGFQFMRLDTTLFDKDGKISEPVTYLDLARYVFFTETQRDLDEKKMKKPYIGECDETEYFLFFTEKGKNTFAREGLKKLPKNGTRKVVYADRCLLSEETLRNLNIVFKQIPYQVKLY
ncbi:hypothetical protein A3A67_01825 [Candidatus Peribacteria bacterium RIFCSPLOWO2_01_FULL_51_18]|nr:MAG: hypothetical protein A3C52_03735 [Candidatus Peribacteria bacterium RIFCSPHIGHO2_02_FULL_51_15]OGJ65203.1 MAG: hypothetical protein A3A67_01825 [Candidatus Peribacteria bacterium RIFCSPLOWO2_01_FULL_51_18]